MRTPLRVFASTSETDARKLAALLGFRYCQLPDGSFDHSLLITHPDRQGRGLATATTLVDNADFQAKLRAATATEALEVTVHACSRRIT